MILPEKKLILHINWGLLICSIALFTLGVINLHSASSIRVEDGITLAPFFEKQLIWGLGGLVVITACTLVDYHHIDRWAPLLYFITLICLALVPLIGKTVYGATRWLDFGLISFQPSEMAKIAVLLMGAKVLAKNGESLGWMRLFGILLVALIPFSFVVVQPDLGTSITLILVLGGMVMYHGIKWRVFRVCLLMVPLLMPMAWFALHDYQKQRIITFMDPSQDPRGSGYHIIQSQIAIGSGEMTGKGYLQGTQSQLRFLPEKHTDFAVAVWGEEWGFAGCLALLTLFCLFLSSIYSTIRDARDRLGSLLAAGVFFYFLWQIFINIGMVLGLMPVVGIPLPFISYGGTAMIVNSALVGLVLNVSMRRFVFKG